MDAKYVVPFVNSVKNVLPQLGIENVRAGKVQTISGTIENPGVIAVLGIAGDLKGNIFYAISEECAYKIASAMMMGMEVNEFDEMAQSAISELSNMLTANATIELAQGGIKVDITTPTLICGTDSSKTCSGAVSHIEMFVDDMPFDVNISVE